MGTQPTKINPKSHKFTKLKNWAHQIYQKARFTNTLQALLITRRRKPLACETYNVIGQVILRAKRVAQNIFIIHLNYDIITKNEKETRQRKVMRVLTIKQP